MVKKNGTWISTSSCMAALNAVSFSLNRYPFLVKKKRRYPSVITILPSPWPTRPGPTASPYKSRGEAIEIVAASEAQIRHWIAKERERERESGVRAGERLVEVAVSDAWRAGVE